MKMYNETPTGYRFNKLLFFSVILFLLCIFIVYFFINGYEQHPYLKCNAEKCINPVAASKDSFTIKQSCPGIYCPPVKCTEEWCNQEYVSRGEYGKKPSWIQTSFSYIAWGLITLMFIINHLLFNKGVKFSIPTKRKILPSWLAWIVKKIHPKFENEIDLKQAAKNIKEMKEE